MSIFKQIFRPTAYALEQQMIADSEALAKEEAAKAAAEKQRLKDEAEARRIEAMKPKKSEEEQRLEEFSVGLAAEGRAIDSARSTLFDKKAQLAVMRNNQGKLSNEIQSLEAELSVIEGDWAKACDANTRGELEIKGSNLQRAISNKKIRLSAQLESLGTFEATIDVLEKNVMNKENELSVKQTRLESAETAVAVIALNAEIDNSLKLTSTVDETGLDVFIERQKVVLEDVSTKVTALNTVDPSMALPFKQRMEKEAIEGELVE
ncbi:coil containing protein [Vibrio phage 1.026.O._10N.222.49.C7]|uniref:Coil containing protein n=1 Tax=Vibrio phage 1.026.O._10N.222.49.C7 TaxID=1881421 RepID=A0A2I7QMN1_9CAUD|nr:coil containing protein [Vibrio phage 1.026.O._10N.222.49.C7]AUR82659.1 coil containing protein [Vibrio phage 1.026.O._10N.222.49.C7]